MSYIGKSKTSFLPTYPHQTQPPPSSRPFVLFCSPMENRFKLRISRIFRSSFGSCRPKNTSDVIEQPIFAAQNHQHYQLVDLLSQKPRPFPSICRPKWPEADDATEDGYVTLKHLYPRRKISDRQSLLASTGVQQQKFPPASPIFSIRNTSSCKSRELRKKPKKKAYWENRKFNTHELNSSAACSYSGMFSSDEDEEDYAAEDDDKTTLFSSNSLSTDSSKSFGQSKAHLNKISLKTRGKRAARKDSEKGLMPLQGKVKDSFAVVKSSSDPYSDFRTSMVEMIVEKQIFTPKDLENLLQCFLFLNSYHHHRVIIEVFVEIWEALFS